MISSQKWSVQAKSIERTIKNVKKIEEADKSHTVMNDSQGTSNHIRVAFSEITQPDKNEEHEKDGLKFIGMFFFFFWQFFINLQEEIWIYLKQIKLSVEQYYTYWSWYGCKSTTFSEVEYDLWNGVRCGWFFLFVLLFFLLFSNHHSLISQHSK